MLNLLGLTIEQATAAWTIGIGIALGGYLLFLLAIATMLIYAVARGVLEVGVAFIAHWFNNK